MLRRVDENILYILIRSAGLLWNGGHLSLASARLSCTRYNDDTADTLHLVCLLREREETALSSRFFFSAHLLPPLCSGSTWKMMCDRKPKFPLIKRPLWYILEQEGKRSVSSRREARRGFWQVSVTAEVEDECTCVHTCGRHRICHTNTRLERTDSSPTVAREQMPRSYHQTQSNAPHSWRAIAWFLFPLTGS